MLLSQLRVWGARGTRSFSKLALPPSFYQELPKADLHVHLDGSMRLGTVVELAKTLPLPPLPLHPKLKQSDWTEEMFDTEVFKPAYSSLVEYLTGFVYTIGCMRSEENLTRVAYEFAKDCQADNVLYVEPRFAPQLLASDSLSIRQILLAVQKGMDMAKREYNNKASGLMFDYGIIVCGMRAFDPNNSEYYAQLCRVMPSVPYKRRAGLASLILAQEAVVARDEDGVPVVALDVAGAEAGFPCDDHVDAYRFAHKNFMHSTVHAGEAYGPESIYQAITDLYATRIGHGYHLYHCNSIQDPSIADREKYTRNLIDFITRSNRTVEVCLTSNLQTLEDLAKSGLQTHSLANMLRDEINVVLCTDNTLMSKTTLSREFQLATENFAGMRQLESFRRVVLNGFKQAFCPGATSAKAEHVAQASRLLEQVLRKYRAEEHFQH